MGDKMDRKNFVLTYYKNAIDGIHIHRVEKSIEAQKPHTHEYFQIYYIIKGTLMHFAGENASLLSQGDMFIIPPGKVHYIREADGAVFYSFSFMPDSLGAVDASYRLVQSFLKTLQEGETVKAKISVPAKDALFTENLMEQIYKEFTGGKIGSGEIIRSCALALLAMFARNYFEKIQPEISASDNRELMLHCVEYIKNNYIENITLDEMAKRSAMSKSCFCKLFYEICGTTFNKYLNQQRIKAATKYINEGYKITGIYGLCGYNDFTTFYRNFKKITGISPRRYKAEKLN